MTLKQRLVGASVLIAGAYFWFSQPKTVDAVTVEVRDLEHSIVASGRVEPQSRFDIASLVSATIAQIHVKEGDWVKAKQPLVQLSDPTLSASLALAQANLLEAEQRLTELEQLTLPNAQNTAKYASSQYQIISQEHQRNQSLFKKNLLSSSQLEQSEKSLDNARLSLDNAQLQLKNLNSSGNTRKLLETKLAQAQANFSLTQKRIEQLTLSSPIDAIVLNRYFDNGSTIQPSKTLLTLVSAATPHIEISIDEKHLRHITKGQQAIAIADAYPKQPFTAKIEHIYPSIDANKATIKVDLSIDNPPAFLLPDMTISVEMLIERLTQVMVLPTYAIHDIDSAQPWVWTIEDGKATTKNIVLGIQGTGYTQIVRGLTAGEWVVAQDITTGKKIKARPIEKKVAPQGMDVTKGLS